MEVTLWIDNKTFRKIKDKGWYLKPKMKKRSVGILHFEIWDSITMDNPKGLLNPNYNTIISINNSKLQELRQKKLKILELVEIKE